MKKLEKNQLSNIMGGDPLPTTGEAKGQSYCDVLNDGCLEIVECKNN